jgi:hypothetical protein
VGDQGCTAMSPWPLSRRGVMMQSFDVGLHVCHQDPSLSALNGMLVCHNSQL